MRVSSAALCPLLGRHQYATLWLTTWPHYPSPLAESPPSKYNNLVRHTWASLVQKAPVPTLSQQNTKDQNAFTILLVQYSDSPKLLTQKSRKAQTFGKNDARAHKHQHGWGTQALGLTTYMMNTGSVQLSSGSNLAFTWNRIIKVQALGSKMARQENVFAPIA